MAGKGKKRGPKTVWTEEVIQALTEALNVGCTVKIACEYAGIGQSTYYEHCQEAPEFAEDMLRARNRGAVRDLAFITKHAQVDWRAAAWKLEHVFADDFASKQRHEMSGHVQVEADDELDAKLDELIALAKDIPPES